MAGSLLITGANSSGFKQFTVLGGGEASGTSNGASSWWNHGMFKSTSTVSSVSVHTNSGSFDSGTIYVYTSVS
jgi:hypothetical protein